MNSFLDKQLDSQPKKVVFCKRCVVSNQRPRTEIDEEGVCGACRWSDRKKNEIDWAAREKELAALCDKHRSKDGKFDVVVPGSGGKDSGHTAHLLKAKYGMHPLCVTWAPFIYTDIGWKNFQNFVKSGFTTINCFPNGALHRKLAKVAFELKGDAWEPFTYGQKAFAFNIAVKFGIPLIFYGENGEVEYGGSLKNAGKPYESPDDWDELYFKGAGIDALLKQGLETGVFSEEEIKDPALEFYRPPKREDIEKLGAQMHWISYYRNWIPQENFYYAQKHTGFTANEEGRSEGTYSKYASLDDKTDGFHFYLGYIKFGLGRATRDAMMEVRSGHITREEAVALVKRYDGEFPKKYFKEFLEYLDITEEHFWEIIDFYRQPHLWEKVNGEWKLKYQVS
ncbi:MAG: N-acetyl sugar amidotransferase [Candidatus Niyogibacteria bacterium]|nr:MAG: N-acetyl sugar amidotransferase [Candidatus Niyogibacteria bacterium]